MEGNLTRFVEACVGPTMEGSPCAPQVLKKQEEGGITTRLRATVEPRRVPHAGEGEVASSSPKASGEEAFFLPVLEVSACVSPRPVPARANRPGQSGREGTLLVEVREAAVSGTGGVGDLLLVFVYRKFPLFGWTGRTFYLL